MLPKQQRQLLDTSVSSKGEDLLCSLCPHLNGSGTCDRICHCANYEVKSMEGKKINSQTNRVAGVVSREGERAKLPLNIFPPLRFPFPSICRSLSPSLTFRLCPWKLFRHYGHQGECEMSLGGQLPGRRQTPAPSWRASSNVRKFRQEGGKPEGKKWQISEEGHKQKAMTGDIVWSRRRLDGTPQ